jgi:hypothetical protein
MAMSHPMNAPFYCGDTCDPRLPQTQDPLITSGLAPHGQLVSVRNWTALSLLKAIAAIKHQVDDVEIIMAVLDSLNPCDTSDTKCACVTDDERNQDSDINQSIRRIKDDLIEYQNPEYNPFSDESEERSQSSEHTLSEEVIDREDL